MTTAATVLNLASQQLVDISQIKWFPDLLIGYLNLALKEIVNLKPDAYTKLGRMTLVSGIQQPLPATITVDGDSLPVLNVLDVTYNMGTSGTTIGDAILEIPKNKMDNLLPNWTTFPATTDVKYAVTDDRDPKNWYCFPPQPSPAPGQQIQALFQVLPVPIAAASDTFPLDDSFIPACVNYVVGRALLERTEGTNAQQLHQKGQWFMTEFMRNLGLKTNIEQGEEQKQIQRRVSQNKNQNN